MTMSFGVVRGDEERASDGAGSSCDGDAKLHGHRARVVNLFGLIAIAFFLCGGGAYGIEPAVAAGGPLLVIVGYLVLTFVWALPMGLFTAEMSTMFDENGGYILWVDHALGRLAGWVNAFNAVFASVIDLPVAVVLAVDYLTNLLTTDATALPWYADVGIKAAIVAVVAWFNLRGLEVVEMVSAVLGVAVLLPFVAMLVVACVDGTIAKSARARRSGACRRPSE